MAKILIVDDERTTGKIVETFLSKRAYETFTAEDGQKGLDIFCKEKPEIALIDVQMPVRYKCGITVANNADKRATFTIKFSVRR